MSLRDLGPFDSVQLTPPRPDWPDGADVATANGLVRAPLGGAVGALTNHGGPVIASVKLVALYAGSFWANRQQNDVFLHELCAYGYLTAAAPQGVGNGTYVGGFDIPAPAQLALHDSDCQHLIAAAIGQNGVPQPDDQTLYMLIFPSGVSVTFDGTTESSCTQFCGYHSSMTVGTHDVAYTVQTATDCNGCNLGDAVAGFTMVQAHELTEACTDPHGTSWYNDTTGAENADECAWVPLSWGPWTVQGYAALVNSQWVNSLGAYTPVQTPQPKPQSPEDRFWETVGPYTDQAAKNRDKTAIGTLATIEGAWMAYWKRQQDALTAELPELPPMPS